MKIGIKSKDINFVVNNEMKSNYFLKSKEIFSRENIFKV